MRGRMPFGISTTSKEKAGKPPAMHEADAEILAAINGSGSGPLSPRTSSIASTMEYESDGDCDSSADSFRSSDASDGTGKKDGGKRRKAGGGDPFRGYVANKFRATKRRERRSLLGGLVALAVLASLGLSSSSAGGLFGASPPDGEEEEGSGGRALTIGSVPRSLSRHLADLDDAAPDADGDGAPRALPVFWHVLKSGGTMIQDLSNHCFDLTVASEVGATGPSDAAPSAGEEGSLRVMEVNEGARHVNVDVTIAEGIERAGKLGLAQSGLVDVLFTPLLVETSQSILSEAHPGRMFALFRHPVHRAVSQFYYLRDATWEPTYNPALKTMELEDWAFTPLVESNWMVRSLVGKMEGPITGDDLEGAKEVLRRKCLVGLLDRMEESVERFRMFFGWKYGESDANRCVASHLGNKDVGNRNDHPFPLKEDDAAWRELERKNSGDMALYNYARTLFEEQGATVTARVRERTGGGSAADGAEGAGNGEEGDAAAASADAASGNGAAVEVKE